MSRPPPSLSVSQYMRILSRYFPPSICQTGTAPRLAGDVPQGDFYAADAARLPGVPAELLYAVENLFYVARILAENPAFEHRRVRPARRVADFAVADDSLVGVDFDERAAFRRAVDVREAHIRNFKSGRFDFHNWKFAFMRHTISPKTRPRQSID